MSTVLRAQVRIPNISTLAQDTVVNTWHFRSTNLLRNVDVETAHEALVDWYQGMQEYASPALSALPSITWYDLVDGEPRTPIITEGFVWDPTGGTMLPNEVAIVMSYHAAPASGVNAGRRRGRIYMGPFNTGPIANSDFGSVVSSAFRDDWQNITDAFFDQVTGGTATWCVFSPTTAGPAPWTEAELMSSSFPVVGAHCDNAFDTVRSRGVPATDRTTIPVT